MCQISCRINAVVMNSTPKWSKSRTRHFLTECAEGLTIAMSDVRKNIMGFRISGNTFGAVNKIHFMGRDSLKNERMKTISKYVNVHVITVNRETKMAKCSCGHKESTGRPCVHLLLIVDNFYPEMFNVRWTKVYNSTLYESNESINKSFKTLRDRHDRSPGWSYVGNGWKCDDDVSLINDMSESQKHICKAILKMQKDGVPCYFGSNGPIIPPPYCNSALTQRNDDTSVFRNDYQFGAPDTEDLFVPTTMTMTETSQQKYSKIEASMKTTWKWVQGTAKYEDEFVQKMKQLEEEFAVKVAGNVKVVYKPGQLISSNETLENKRQRYKRLKPAGEMSQSPQRKRRTQTICDQETTDSDNLGASL